MKRTIKIAEEDRNRIEKLHYLVEARANLLNRLAGQTIKVENYDSMFAQYLEKYEEVYEEYSKLKEKLEEKYKDVPNATSWEIVFETAEMIFEVPDASE